MLFRVQVVVITAVRPAWRDMAHASDNSGCADAVRYSFGINAEDAGSAARLADRAAEHARDRDGDYIGGAIAELTVCRVRAEEFDGYQDYLLQPATAPGIFYVTGTCTFGMPHGMCAGTLEALTALRQSIRERGLPPPSFVHPKPPDSRPSKRTRILCPRCHRWAEFDSAGVIDSLCDCLDPASRESQIGRQAGRALGAFIEEHASCLKYSRDIAFVFLDEEDPRYGALDPAMSQWGARRGPVEVASSRRVLLGSASDMN